jgi:aspartyl-tRNA(Asn)/glutamyl-tRNA(Gln) amidotransferase subunit A
MKLPTLAEQRKQIQSGQISAAEIADECYRRIEQLNPSINAFITVMQRGEIFAPKDSALYGIPIAVKDLFNTKGTLTTGGTKFFADYIPDEDAAAVTKVKNAGAQILGKTNTHEVALGVTNNNPHYGACKNPWDLTRISGGSSGGSAAAVAMGMATAALGTDTGGSIRIPASLCGVVGLKPTYGRVSMRGVIPLSWNLDHAGPLTRTVEDAAWMLQAMSGYDEHDPASAPELSDDYLSALKEPIQKMRVAFAVGNFVEDVTDAEVSNAVREAARVLKDLGAVVTEVNTDFLREAAQANTLMTQADGAAFHRERLKEHPDWFGADVRQRLETGAGFTSSEYSLARRTQSEAKRKLALFFRNFEALILPTTAISAPVLEGEDALERARLLTRLTSPFNLTGLPALSVPCGLTRARLPIGLQIVSRAWNEYGVLRLGHAFEQATAWHTYAPD